LREKRFGQAGIMEKGKTKSARKYLSILFVPRYLGEVREVKIYGHRFILSAAVIAVSAALFFFGSYINNITAENKTLNSAVEVMQTMNAEQNVLLADKLQEITKAAQYSSTIDDKINEFTDLYRQMTENYLRSKLDSSLSSRSSESTGLDFVSDLKEVRSLIGELEKLNEEDDSVVVDLTEIEASINKYLDTVPTLYPASGEIISKFGKRTDPITKTKRMHEGLDIDAPYGANIKAAASGTVESCGYQSGYGKVVIINHGRGVKTVYAHTSKILVEVGQTVKKGDIIAKVGSTGRSTGPHLHFEVRINGEPVNPLKYLDY
jgi:murein DD-endopeptidase MepM/ murein hydrolase activator NlpD